jgi:Fur family peroxide stress response transcriptional regulator
LKKKYKRSKHRDRILRLLKSTETHPTASWIYDELKKEISNLSLGTVYRNLNILAEQGLIRKFNFGSTFDRYDADITPHYHFCCENCGRFVDLGTPVNEDLNREVEKTTGFKISKHRIEFYGMCDKCLNAGKKRKSFIHSEQGNG